MELSEKKLTRKEEAFIRYYCETLNASEAARRAGYSPKTARQIGSENLSKPVIKARIDERLEALTMTKGELLTRVSEVAGSSLEDFLRFDEIQPGKNVVTIDVAKAKTAAKLGLIKKFRNSRYGVEIELYDKLEALELLGRHLGLWRERVSLENPDGSAVAPVFIRVISAEEALEGDDVTPKEGAK